MKGGINFYKRKIILEDFEIVALTLREKDLDKNEYLKLVEKIYPICQKYRIDLILHQNYDLNLDEKYNIGAEIAQSSLLHQYKLYLKG